MFLWWLYAAGKHLIIFIFLALVMLVYVFTIRGRKIINLVRLTHILLVCDELRRQTQAIVYHFNGITVCIIASSWFGCDTLDTNCSQSGMGIVLVTAWWLKRCGLWWEFENMSIYQWQDVCGGLFRFVVIAMNNLSAFAII